MSSASQSASHLDILWQKSVRNNSLISKRSFVDMRNMRCSIKWHWMAKVKIRNIFAEVCVSVLQNLRLSEKRYIRLPAGWWGNILHPCLDFVEHSVAPHSEKMSPEQDLMEFRDWIVSQENWNPVSFDSHKTLSKADWIPLHNLLWFSLPPLV